MSIVHFRRLIKFGFKFGCRLTLQHPVKKLTWLRARLHLAYWASTFLVSCFLFFFFVSMRMNCNSNVHAHGFTVQETKYTVHWTYNHFVKKKKKIKNEYHSTIHPFKNYFATVFSVFSKINCIRTDPAYLENLTIDYIFLYFNKLVQFYENRILFTIWSVNLFLIRNFKLQKLAI